MNANDDYHRDNAQENAKSTDALPGFRLSMIALAFYIGYKLVKILIIAN